MKQSESPTLRYSRVKTEEAPFGLCVVGKREYHHGPVEVLCEEYLESVENLYESKIYTSFIQFSYCFQGFLPPLFGLLWWLSTYLLEVSLGGKE